MLIAMKTQEEEVIPEVTDLPQADVYLRTQGADALCSQKVSVAVLCLMLLS